MNYPKVNRHFTFACFFAAPVAGTAASILWHGGAIWCLFSIVFGRQRLSRDKLMFILTTLLYLYVFISLVSFFANGGNSTTAKELAQLATLLLFPFSYSVWTIANKTEIAKAASFGAMVACYGALILALIQFFFFDMRPEGGAGNALVFATVTSLAGIACLAGALLLNTSWQLALLGGYFSAITAIIMSGSRSIWLAMAVASLVTLIACHTELRILLKKYGKLALLALVLITVLTSGELATRVSKLAEDWNQLVHQQSYDSSLGLRIALWEAASNLIRESPFLGHGLQNTRPILYQAIKENTGLEVSFSHFHNGFLTIAVESGLIALAAIVGVLLVVMLAAIKALASKSAEARFGGILLTGLAITYVLGGIFNLILGQDVIDATFVIFLIIGSWLACGTSQQEPL